MEESILKRYRKKMGESKLKRESAIVESILKRYRKKMGESILKRYRKKMEEWYQERGVGREAQ